MIQQKPQRDRKVAEIADIVRYDYHPENTVALREYHRKLLNIPQTYSNADDVVWSTKPE